MQSLVEGELLITLQCSYSGSSCLLTSGSLSVPALRVATLAFRRASCFGSVTTLARRSSSVIANCRLRQVGAVVLRHKRCISSSSVGRKPYLGRFGVFE